MDLSYCECCIKKNEKINKIKKVVWVLLTFYAFAFNVLWYPSLTFSVLIFINIIVLIFFWPNFSAEYEYVFCDGQIDFDLIRDKRKRKTLKKIDLVDVDLVCKKDDERLAKYREFNWKKTFVSGNNPDNEYVIILRRGNNGYNKIVFEPDERMLKSIKNKSPRIINIPLNQ